MGVPLSAALFDLARWAFHHRARVVVGWLLVLTILFGGVLLLSKGPNNTYQFPGTQSQEALDELSRTFPQFSGTSAQLIAVAPDDGDVTDSDFQSAVEDTIAAIEDIPQVSGVTDPYDASGSANIADANAAVLVPIQLEVAANDVDESTSEAIQSAGRSLDASLPDGSQVAVGGALYSQVDPGIGVSEVVSLLIALVVLLFTFGTLLAAGMPLVTAVVGVGAAVSLVLISTQWLTITSTGPLLAVMLGLAVGIDYALFIVSRHQEQLRRGMTPDESAPRAVATAGSAVVFAALTVIIALLGLSVAGVPFLTITGASAALAVASAALVALTMTPALLGILGWRAVPRRQRPGARDRSEPGSEASPGSDSAADDDAGDQDADPETDTGAEADEIDAAADMASAGAMAPVPRTSPVDAADADTSSVADTEPEKADEPEDVGAADSVADDTGRDADAETRPGGFFGRWVRAVTRFPPLTVVGVVLLLGLAAVPVMGLRLALPDSGSLPEGSPGRVTYDLIAEYFGAGANGPLIVTGSVIQSTDPVTLVDDIGDRIADVPGVKSVPLATPNETGTTAVIQVIPTGSPDSPETAELVRQLRGMQDEFLDDFAVDLSVTGYTALGIDISDRLGASMVPFGALVVGLSLILLTIVFRSIAVPVTAALGYVLSVGAAFGLTTLVFVDGWLAQPLNVHGVGEVSSFMPIIVMGVLFGLAMDYEMFLVSRMREEWVRRGDARDAIEHGFVGAARVVTAAALIMTAVFAGFIREGEASLQPIAFGLATGVAIDAFIVRMTFIPAVLRWLGPRAWWIPRTLDRVLPHADAEGEAIAHEDDLADWPGDGEIAIAADGLQADGDTAPLEARVPAGGILVIDGGTTAQRRALLLALTGRAPLTSGDCRVIGLVLPTRAAAVRSLSAVASVRRPDPVGALQDAVALPVRLLGVDGADAIGDAHDRRALAAAIADARAPRPARGGQALTLILTAEHRSQVEDLIPAAASVTTVSLLLSPALAGAGP